MINLDGKCQSPEKPQSGVITAKEIIRDQPRMGALLKSL